MRYVKISHVILTLRYVTLYLTSRFVTLHYVTLRYVTLRFGITCENENGYEYGYEKKAHTPTGRRICFYIIGMLRN